MKYISIKHLKASIDLLITILDWIEKKYIPSTEEMKASVKAVLKELIQTLDEWTDNYSSSSEGK